MTATGTSRGKSERKVMGRLRSRPGGFKVGTESTDQDPGRPSHIAYQRGVALTVSKDEHVGGSVSESVGRGLRKERWWCQVLLS